MASSLRKATGSLMSTRGNCGPRAAGRGELRTLNTLIFLLLASQRPPLSPSSCPPCVLLISQTGFNPILIEIPRIDNIAQHVTSAEHVRQLSCLCGCSNRIFRYRPFRVRPLSSRLLPCTLPDQDGHWILPNDNRYDTGKLITPQISPRTPLFEP